MAEMKAPTNLPIRAHGAGGLTHGYLLRTNARKVPNKEAVIDSFTGRILTFNELYLESNRLANALLDLGLKKGDHVAWICWDRGYVFDICFGLAKVGIAQTPLNYRFLPHELQSHIDHCDAKAVILHEDFIDRIEPIRSSLRKVKHYVVLGDDLEKRTTPEGTLNFWQLIEKASDEDPEARVGGVSPDDLFGVFHTAGTTGLPKGVMHSQHSALGWNHCAAIGFGIGFKNRFGWFMPLYHWGGYVGPLTAVLIGATAIVGPYSPDSVWSTIAKYRMDQMLLVAIMWVGALIALPKYKNLDISCFRCGMHGAAALPPEVAKQIFTALPDIDFLDLYSSTEAIFSCADRHMLEEHPGTVGIPFYGREISIRDEKDRTKELPPGEVGVIYGRGSSTHLGYYKDEKETKRCFLPDGWQTSEDMGLIEPETGLLYIYDRAKDIINRSGETISSLEVENVVLQHPDVMQCAVVGIPDPTVNEEVCAVVTLRPGTTATAEEIVEFCRGKIAGFKRPRRVEIVAELPRNAVGKILKRELRKSIIK